MLTRWIPVRILKLVYQIGHRYGPLFGLYTGIPPWRTWQSLGFDLVFSGWTTDTSWAFVCPQRIFFTGFCDSFGSHSSVDLELIVLLNQRDSVDEWWKVKNFTRILQFILLLAKGGPDWTLRGNFAEHLQNLSRLGRYSERIPDENLCQREQTFWNCSAAAWSSFDVHNWAIYEITGLPPSIHSVSSDVCVCDKDDDEDDENNRMRTAN